MNQSMVLALCGAMVIGCGASNNDETPAPDSGTTGGTDVVAVVDSGISTDRGVAATDRGVATERGAATDRGTTPAGNFGMCAAAVPAFCMCAMTDDACFNRAVSSDMTCVQCLVQNQADCCPTEAMAVQTCVMGANGTCMNDQGCLRRACMTQLTALQTCQNTRLERESMAGSGACLAGYLACLGDLAQGLDGCP